MSLEQELELLWERLLSEQESLVLRALYTLDAEETQGAIEHLRRVADPLEGYTRGQQEAARFALTVIERQRH